VAAASKGFGVQIGLAIELGNSLGDFVGVLLLFTSVF